MLCDAVNRCATLLFMGAASLVCGGSGGSVLEVLFSLQPNAVRLCGNLCSATIWHCANVYGTKDTHYEERKLKLLI